MLLCLVNVILSSFFKSSRGLRQGDPLSPYLFVLVMEILSCLLCKVKVGKFIEGFLVDGWCCEGVGLLFVLCK